MLLFGGGSVCHFKKWVNPMMYIIVKFHAYGRLSDMMSNFSTGEEAQWIKKYFLFHSSLLI